MNAPNSKQEPWRAEQVWCRHYTGIAYRRCDEGIVYDTVKDTSRSPSGWPCFAEGESLHGSVPCEHASFLSDDEAKAKHAENETHLAAYLSALAEGKCPICKVVVEKRQVGRCVYGSCGHRLYQGKLA